MLDFAVTNIGNVGRDVYVWHRVGKQLYLQQDKTFFPYFYQLDPKGVFHTIDNQRVTKIFCSRPSDVPKKRNENSYEADILYPKRYIIDRIGSFLPGELKYSFMDIEVLAKELPSYLNPIYPISCISCSNSYTGEIKTFFLLDYEKGNILCDIIENIELCEKELLNAFVKWIKEQQFDLLLGWNFIEFDWRYLSARYKYIFGCELATILSPIAQVKYLGSIKQEVQPNLIPVGLSVCDYLDFYKKIYKQESSYALDAVANKELKLPIRKKIDFSILSEDIKIKNREDVRLLMEIDKVKKIIEYYDELRRMSMCEWSDVTWNSKMIDMILLREAKQRGIILPSKKYGEDDPTKKKFEGAYRRCNIENEEGETIETLTGFYKGLWKFDLSSAYPMAIINFCLDVANLTENKNNQQIDITDRVTNTVKYSINVVQNPNALLPIIARKLISKKDIIKAALVKANPDSEEGKDLQIKYDAIKAVVNSLFGVCGLKIFRLFNVNIASAITSIVRDLLHYTEDKLKEHQIKAVYLDTDGIMIDAKDNPKELIDSLVNQWAKEKYNRTNLGIDFDLEGRFEKILIVALCHYKGYLRTTKGKLKEEIKGIEAKRKDSSKFIKEFQDILIDKIMNEESQEEIVKFINSEKERIKTLSLIDIGFPCRINADKEYASIPKFMRGLEYTKEIISTFDKRPGDSFYWIPVMPFGKATRKSSRNKTDKVTGEKTKQSSEKEVNKDVLVFDEEQYQHIKDLDWNTIIDKSILDKCENIFNALNWDISLIKEIKPKRERRKTDRKKDKEEEEK